MTIGHLRVVTLCCLVGFTLSAGAYEIATHRDLTAAAANRSVLRLNPSTLRDLGLDKNIDDASQRFPNSKNDPRHILQLLQDGAAFEDDLFTTVRVLRHFYNPITGQGLSTLVLPAQTPSPDWALTRRGSDPNQQFSYWDARQYLFDALTKATEADRRRSFGLAFQTLGQVVHHLQDMAVPEHVRNDPHCAIFVICAPLGAYAPALYEAWTDQVRNSLPLDPGPGGQARGYEAQNVVQPPFASTFNSTRRFWHTEPAGPNSPAVGRGMAEFTNRNFVSRGTNFSSSSFAFLPNSNFPSPVPTSTPASVERVPIGSLMPGTALQGQVWFVASEVQDNLTGRTVTNPRASTFSVFDEDLRRLAPSFGRAFTLNQFNFRAAHEFLIPRAVAYSAGMINYFFRGKIDFVPDPNSAGQHLIRNLGSEPMKGKFRLYYDDQDGNRNQVLDAGGQALVWDTEVILAAAQGVLAAGASLPVPGFVPPSSPPPKTPGEYMLVFSGDMGEERAEAGGVGAVVGKLIRNEYKGALYIVGLDANGVITSLRADKDGTKVLAGWDISKRDANNPNGVLTTPALGVFDPLGFLYSSSTAKPVRDKIYAYKQAEYGPGPIEYTATSVTLTHPDNPNTLRSHYGAALGQVSFGQVIWAARSPDEQVGTFEFQIVNIRNVGRDADVQFTRRFKDSAGVSRVAIGGVPMPTLTSLFSYQQINGLREPFNSSFPLVISDDGLTIKGFATTGSLSTRVHSRIVITLAQTPQVRLEQTTFAPTVSGLDFFPPPPFQPGAPCSVDVRRDGTTITVTANGFVRKGNNDFESSLKEEVPIGNQAREIVSYVRESLVKRTESVDESICFATGTDFDPATGLQRPKYSIRNTVSNDVQPSGGTFERFVGGDYSVPAPNVPNESISVGQLKGGYSGSPFLCRDCTWNEIYEGFDPVPPVQMTLNFGISFRRESVGKNVVRALTDRHADVIFGESASGTQPFIRKFRTIVLTGKEYVADSSPLGEVFFAISDKSVMIHEPVPGGMPPVRIPENVVKLLAVLWL